MVGEGASNRQRLTSRNAKSLVPQTMSAGRSASVCRPASTSARYGKAATSCRGAITAGARRDRSLQGARYAWRTSRPIGRAGRTCRA